MRVLMLAEDPRDTYTQAQGGGAESLREDIIRGLQARGHSVARLGLEDFRGQAPDAVMSDACSRLQPDAVMVSTIHNFIGVEPIEWLQRERIPNLLMLNDYWPFCGPRMCLVRGDCSCSAVRGRCDRECGQGLDSSYVDLVNGSYHVTYNPHSADIMRRHGLRVDATVDLGVDERMFYPDEESRGPVDRVFTSSAWPEWPTKGMHILRQACAGGCWGVALISKMKRADVARALRQAHIYVMPSCYEETWGLCLTEAMMTGCACIASDVAGPRHQIRSGLTGLLVPPRNPEALRQAVEALLEDDALRVRLGHNARAWAAERYTLGEMAQRWESVLEGLT